VTVPTGNKHCFRFSPYASKRLLRRVLCIDVVSRSAQYEHEVADSKMNNDNLKILKTDI